MRRGRGLSERQGVAVTPAGHEVSVPEDDDDEEDPNAGRAAARGEGTRKSCRHRCQALKFDQHATHREPDNRGRMLTEKSDHEHDDVQAGAGNEREGRKRGTGRGDRLAMKWWVA